MGDHDVAPDGAQLEVDPALLVTSKLADDTARKEDVPIGGVEHQGPPAVGETHLHADDEVVWGDWITLRDLDRLLRDPAFHFVPDTRQLLARLATAGVHDYAALRTLAP